VKLEFRSPCWVSVLAGCLALAGCSTQNNDYSQYFQLMRQSLANSFSNGAIPRQEAAAVPYATIGYRLNGGRETLLILATDTNGERLWTASSHVVLLTRDGRLSRTVGLPDNIGSVMPSLSAAMVPPGQVLKSAFTSIRSADFPDEGRYSVSISCKTVSMGRAMIKILGKALDTVRADETCNSSALEWSFRDSYWVDAQNGFVWRAFQHLTPKGETVETEVLRPPG
jgi:hypothetical protein